MQQAATRSNGIGWTGGTRNGSKMPRAEKMNVPAAKMHLIRDGVEVETMCAA
jgi:hypothetical protein